MKTKVYSLDEIPDAFTGELFRPRTPNHYEKNDGVPFAPAVETKRPTVRQRIENLLNRGVNPLAAYVGTEGIDMDVPDDPDAPLTEAEQLHIEMVAANIAEQAPLPDEGLPRDPQPVPHAPVPSAAPSPAGAPPAAPAAGEGVRPAQPAGPLAAQPQPVVPTR